MSFPISTKRGLIDFSSPEKPIDFASIKAVEMVKQTLPEAKETPLLCLGRVEDAIRKDKGSWFNPRVVSVGPLHHGNKDLKEVEDLKDQIYAKFWGSKDLPEDASNLIKERVFYSYPKHIQETHRFSDLNYFVNMCFKDACVVLYIIDVCANMSPSSLLAKATFEHCITDLLLLENQLPWALLNLLNNRKFGKGKGQQNVIKFLYAAMDKRLSVSFPDVPQSLFDNAPHLVGMLRELCLMSYYPSKYPFFAYSAKELDEKGVRIKGIQPKENEGLLVGRMEFSWLAATLVTPALSIHDETRFKKLFLNMIAYECIPGVKSNADITTFIHANAALLRDSISVAIGREKFISTRYDNETIVALFKGMSENSFTNFEIYANAKVAHFGPVCKLKVWLREIYEGCFKSPYKVIFVLGVGAAAYIHLLKGVDLDGKGRH